MLFLWLCKLIVKTGLLSFVTECYFWSCCCNSPVDEHVVFVTTGLTPRAADRNVKSSCSHPAVDVVCAYLPKAKLSIYFINRVLKCLFTGDVSLFVSFSDQFCLFLRKHDINDSPSSELTLIFSVFFLYLTREQKPVMGRSEITAQPVELERQTFTSEPSALMSPGEQK